MKITKRQLRELIHESLVDYLRKYGKHSALNVGQVARHLRYPTDLPGAEDKWERSSINVFPEDAEEFTQAVAEMASKLG